LTTELSNAFLIIATPGLNMITFDVNNGIIQTPLSYISPTLMQLATPQGAHVCSYIEGTGYTLYDYLQCNLNANGTTVIQCSLINTVPGTPFIKVGLKK